MKVKQIETTNMEMSKYDGMEGVLINYGTMKLFTPLEYRNGLGYHTSKVSTIHENNGVIVVKTLNSIYRYEILETSDGD